MEFPLGFYGMPKEMFSKSRAKTSRNVFDDARYFRNVVADKHDDVGTNPRRGIERFLFPILGHLIEHARVDQSLRKI